QVEAEDLNSKTTPVPNFEVATFCVTRRSRNSNAEGLLALLPQVNDGIDPMIKVTNQHGVAVAGIVINHIKSCIPASIRLLPAMTQTIVTSQTAHMQTRWFLAVFNFKT